MTFHELEVRLAVAEDQWRRWRRTALIYGSGMVLIGALFVLLALTTRICK
jgi:hypothetical protein